MRGGARYIPSILILVIGILSMISTAYRPLTFAITFLLVFMVLNKMGRGIVLRESTAILYILTCLFMPMIGYMYYTVSNPLARMWMNYMRVPEETYFSFALPALSAFCLAITWPITMREGGDEGEPLKQMIARIRQKLGGDKKYGVTIMIIGVVAGRIANYLPGALQFFANLFFFASFAGLLYVFFDQKIRNRKWLIGSFIAFIIYSALGSGMFTIVAYMGVTIFSFFLIGTSYSFIRKVGLLIVGMLFIIVLQNTKLAFRTYTWNQSYSGNKLMLFGSLFAENLQKGSLFEQRSFFPIYSRINQGFNVALVMKRIPRYQEHDKGVNLGKALASSFVPRFLWPDKPEAGGKFNMKFYTNITLRGWSTNIGPLGEAYGAFGTTGGILYMLALGAFIRWAYRRVFVLSRSLPLLLFWIPVLFYQVTYSGETDTLQIMNSLVKSSFFVWLVYKIFPAWLGKSGAGSHEEEPAGEDSNPNVNIAPSYTS